MENDYKAVGTLLTNTGSSSVYIYGIYIYLSTADDVKEKATTTRRHQHIKGSACRNAGTATSLLREDAEVGWRWRGLGVGAREIST